MDKTKEYESLEREQQLDKIRAHKITKSNHLIRHARSSLGALQSKIVAFIISKIEPDDTDFKDMEFNIMDFCDVCKMQSSGMYDHLKKELKKLRDASIWITREDENGNEIEETFSWLSKVTMKKQSGIAVLKVSEDLKPYLLELKENFTSYRFEEVMNFQSKYTAWIYDNLISRLGLGEWLVSLDEIRKQTNTKYEFKYIRSRIIEPSLTEINKYTSLKVDYIKLKKGRSIDKVKFIICSKANKEVIEVDYKEK